MKEKKKLFFSQHRGQAVSWPRIHLILISRVLFFCLVLLCVVLLLLLFFALFVFLFLFVWLFVFSTKNVEVMKSSGRKNLALILQERQLHSNTLRYLKFCFFNNKMWRLSTDVVPFTYILFCKEVKGKHFESVRTKTVLDLTLLDCVLNLHLPWQNVAPTSWKYLYLVKENEIKPLWKFHRISKSWGRILNLSRSQTKIQQHLFITYIVTFQSMTSDRSCPYGTAKTDVIGGNDVNNFTISIPINVVWPVSFIYKHKIVLWKVCFVVLNILLFFLEFSCTGQVWNLKLWGTSWSISWEPRYRLKKIFVSGMLSVPMYIIHLKHYRASCVSIPECI